jgi:hypothetical protein
VGPRAVLDAVVKRKIPNPRRESNPEPQLSSQSTKIHSYFYVLLISFVLVCESVSIFVAKIFSQSREFAEDGYQM